MKKFIFLLFVLVIPASIFVFLKYFGTNTFEVPYLFEEGIPDCQNSSSPHRVSDVYYIGETENQLDSDQLQEFIVYGVFDVSKPEQNKELIVELVRIQDAFFEIGAPYFILFIKGNPDQRSVVESLCKETGLSQKGSSIVYVEYSQLYDFLKCEIALIDEDSEEFTNLVLADPDKRIRGIYNSLDNKQTDQLILELKILKKQF